MPDLTLTVGGMTCSGCARHVTEALEVLPGVASASVPGWESGRADVTLAPDDPSSPADLVAAVEAAGYRAALDGATPDEAPAPPRDPRPATAPRPSRRPSPRATVRLRLSSPSPPSPFPRAPTTSS